MDNILTFIGLMKKAGALVIGADRAGDAAGSGKARLFCIAADCASNSRRAVQSAARESGTPVIELAYTKLELGAALGQSECAALAITTGGFARALAKKLGIELVKAPRRAPPGAAGKAVGTKRANGLDKGDRV